MAVEISLVTAFCSSMAVAMAPDTSSTWRIERVIWDSASTAPPADCWTDPIWAAISPVALPVCSASALTS